ncbi:MAG: DNA polymerase III subunit beta, partial [Chloroflexi bacterium]|nr:DNA polymerase III subunit beta [Chloroflexota bacterium]
MKISCLQENLSRGLSTVGYAVASRSALPVLSNILLTTDSSSLKLAATDLQMVITCKIPCEVDETGATTVPAKLLSEFIGGLPNDEIEMTLNAANQTMHFKSGRFQANVKAIDAEDFPMIPVVTDQPAAGLGGHQLKRLITEVSFAAAPDDARPVLAGVLLSLDGTKLT